MASRRVALFLGLCIATAIINAPVDAQGSLRLIDAIEANDSDRNVNIIVQFNCGVRYIAHSPADVGRSVDIRFRLSGECGPSSFASDRPLVGGSSEFVRNARIEESAPGEITLSLEWAGEAHFVTAPTTDGRGFRLRLLQVLAGPRASVAVLGQGESATGYSVNLESAHKQFTPDQIAASAAFLKVPTYVSTVELEGRIWYRLRAGPIDSRRDAERLLAIAQQRYPRAWLGVNDENSGAPTDTIAVAQDIAPTVPVDPPLPDAVRRALMNRARDAVSRKDYPAAVTVLTQLTRQPEYPGRERAQEMLGLAREKSGQLAHAKAEYGEYLRRYPQGSASGRIRSRMRILASASRVGRAGTFDGGDDDSPHWRISGGASQMYRWERFSLEAPETSTDQKTQNGLYTDADFVARRKGERFDVISRINAGFSKDMLTNGPGDRTRVSSAFLEINDRERGIAGRLGRQSRNDSGLLGTFDGLFVSYQLKSHVAINASFGFPVESTRYATATDRRFVGLAADFGPYKDKWDMGVFAVAQQYAGETDRRAVGIEGRYFVPGRTLVGLIDYDTYYQKLNSAVLTGSLALPARWVASFNLDHRLAPVLTTRNALIGQPVETLDALLDMFTPAQIRQLAEDRTPISDLYSLSLTRPLSERFQVSVDMFGYTASSTPASGGVAEIPESGLTKALQLQLIGSSLLRSSDLFSLQARYEESDTVKIESLGVTSRLPIGGAWRLGPRLRVDRRRLALDAADEIIYVPSLRIDYQRRNAWFELEAGAELGQRDVPEETEDSRRYYFGLGYRVYF